MMCPPGVLRVEPCPCSWITWLTAWRAINLGGRQRRVPCRRCSLRRVGFAQVFQRDIVAQMCPRAFAGFPVPWGELGGLQMPANMLPDEATGLPSWPAQQVSGRRRTNSARGVCPFRRSGAATQLRRGAALLSRTRLAWRCGWLRGATAAQLVVGKGFMAAVLFNEVSVRAWGAINRTLQYSVGERARAWMLWGCGGRVGCATARSPGGRVKGSPARCRPSWEGNSARNSL